MEALASTEKLLQDKVNKTSKVVMLTPRNNPLNRKSAACLKIRLKHLILLQFKYKISLSFISLQPQPIWLLFKSSYSQFHFLTFPLLLNSLQSGFCSIILQKPLSLRSRNVAETKFLVHFTCHFSEASNSVNLSLLDTFFPQLS